MRYSDGSIRLLHDNVWQARYVYTVEADDGQVRKKAVARNFRADSHVEALKERDRIREQLERGALLEELVPAAAKAPLLSKFMRDQIDGMLKSGVIEKTTHTKYRSEANLILRFMKDVQVSKITGAMVRKMDQEMLAAGYARETVARAHNALKRHLYSAQEKGYIASMPITRSNRPSRLDRKDPNGLDEQTRRRLLGIIDEMPDTPFTLAIRLGLGAGLRNEEAIGLKWEFVDLEHGVIKIRNVISMAGDTPELIHVIQTHNSDHNPELPKPEATMEKWLYAVDELSGLIQAVAKMRPSGSVTDMEVKSLKKKFKTKAFAAGCDRDIITKGAELLGIELDELFSATLEAMKGIAPVGDIYAKADESAAPAEEPETPQIPQEGIYIEPLFVDQVDFNTFAKSDFRVVKIKDCEEIPKSKHLLKFTLDDGTGTDRIILSGIKDYYSAEQLVGKTAVAIVNLPPRPFMGIESNGMLISAIHKENGKEALNFLMLDDAIPAGAKLY